MSNHLAYRIYSRNKRAIDKSKHKYLWLASFLCEMDAIFYINSKLNSYMAYEIDKPDFKIMQGNRNHKVYNHDD